MQTIIETERLIIRQINESDFLDLFRLHTDPEVQKLTGEACVNSIEQIENLFKSRTLSDYQKHGYGRWAIIIKDTNEFIGWAGLKYLPEFDEVDLGYRFMKVYWGKGYGTEASRVILQYGFENLGLNRIIAMALPENNASIGIMKKVGMTYYKTEPYEEGNPDAEWYEINNKENIIF